MEFALAAMLLGLYLGLGMVARRYGVGTRLTLIGITLMVAVGFYLIWR